MKKIYTLVFASIFTLQNNAQLTQLNSAPASGDTYTVNNCDSLGINQGASGANAVWNFTQVATRLSVVRNYVVSTPASVGTFSNANVAVASSTNDVSYLKSSSNSLFYYGGNITVGAITGTLIYSSPAIYATYPMSLNTSTTSACTGSINTPLANGTFSGTSNSIADGTGTLILSGIGTTGTFTNTTRVMTSQTLNYTATLGSGVITQINYNYYIQGLNSPAFSIQTATITNSIIGNSTQTLVLRNKSAVNNGTVSTVGLNEIATKENQISVYPNPCNNSLNFKSTSDKLSISITDLTGKIIDTKKLDASASVNTSAYPNGIYFYSIQNDKAETIKNGKFTVVH